MSEQGFAGHQAFALDHGEKGTAQEAAKDAGSRFLDEVQQAPFSLKTEMKSNFYEPKEEYKNGLASEQLIPIEKWADDEKHCGAINQDQLQSKLGEFGKNADDMWKKMQESGDPKQFEKMSGDTYTTYSRFGELFNLLDDSHRDKLLETLPWTLRPGE